MGQGHASPETEEKETQQRGRKEIFQSGSYGSPERTNHVEDVDKHVLND